MKYLYSLFPRYLSLNHDAMVFSGFSSVADNYLLIFLSCCIELKIKKLTGYTHHFTKPVF